MHRSYLRVKCGSRRTAAAAIGAARQTGLMANVTGLALFSAAGQELLERLATVEVSPESALALSASLRAQYPADLVAAALTQQALRVAGRAKFSMADQMLFTRAGLEQASSELTARHAATRF